MTWPNDCPADFRKAVQAVLDTRSHGAADVWGAVKEWLEAHGVEAPETLPEDQKRSGMLGH